jgi:hypothetical protein
VLPVVKHAWTQNIPSQNYFFFIRGPIATYTTILAKIRDLTNFNAIYPWPKFRPQSVNLTCHGQKVAGRANCDVQHADSFTADYLGVIKRSGFSRTTGAGVSTDGEVVVKSVTIPPTIHPAINVGGGVTKSVGYAASAGVGTNLSSRSAGASGIATARVLPTSIAGTPGQQTIPTSGLYIAKMRTEPYRYGYLKVYIELVNAVDFA